MSLTKQQILDDTSSPIAQAMVVFANSWGNSWGVDGYFYLTWEDFNTLLSQQGDVTVLLPMTTNWNYKYFTPTETTGSGHTCAELTPELLTALDKARGIANTPFIITSGIRTLAQNNAVGGKPDSAHLTGEAADIACSDSITRYKIITALLQAGFNRLEIAAAHIHADVSKTLPQNICDYTPND